MAPTDESNTRLPRIRFSMLALLAVTTLCAVLVVVAKALLDEPPTNRIAAYEKAPGTRGKWFEVGPNRVAMGLVARSDRNGTLQYEDGRGGVVSNRVAQDSQVLSTAGPWLDVVQIELEPAPDRVDVIEARVFDHKTRTFVSDVDSAFGWRMVAPDVLQVYGLGKLLPEQLDVWFRLHSYAAGDEVQTIGSAVGSECTLSKGARIKLSDIRAERAVRWSSANGFDSPASGKDDGCISAEFTFQWNSYDGPPLQIVAVLKSGERVHGDAPHLITRSYTPDRMLMTFDADLAELDHFEVRPFGGRERFFFDAVVLPKVSSQPFTAPPLATMSVAGAEVDQRISAFGPLDVRVATHRGMWAGGTRAGGGVAVVTSKQNVTERDQAFTITTATRGLGLSPRTRFVLVGASSPAVTTNLSSSGFSGSASSGNSRAAAVSYRIPLDQVNAIEVELRP